MILFGQSKLELQILEGTRLPINNDQASKHSIYAKKQRGFFLKFRDY